MTPEEPRKKPRSTRLYVLAIGVGTTAVPLDSAVNIAFPDITRSFGITVPMIQWVVISYVLTHASLMLAFGRIGDLFRYDVVFRLGLFISAAAFLLCAAARSFEWLLAARVLQGVGAALILSCGPALTTSLYPEERRSRALAIYAMMFAVGWALGPALGGILVEFAGWPGVYWFRAPIALASLLLLRGIPVERRSASGGSFDVAGAGLIAAALATLLLAITLSSRSQPDFPSVLALGSIAGLATVAFVWWERRASSPLIDVALFTSADFSILNGANLLINLAVFSVMLLVPYYLTAIAHLPTLIAGAVLAAGPTAMALAAPISGWAMRRVTAGSVVALGALMVTLGLFLVSRWTESWVVVALLLPLLLQGFGAGLFQVAYLDSVAEAVPRQDRGVAGSLVMLTRTIGIVLGATTLSLAFATGEGSALRSGIAVSESFIAGFHSAFTVAAVLSGVVTVALLLRLWGTVWLRVKPRPPTRVRSAAQK